MLSAYKNTAYVLLGGALCKAWQLIFSCFSLCALVKRCFPENYNLEHLIVNQSHNILWRSAAYDEAHPDPNFEHSFTMNDFRMCPAWVGPNNCWANFIWIDKDFNRDSLKNKDIINKIIILRGTYVASEAPHNGTYAKKHSHIEIICQHIMKTNGYGELLTAYNNNAPRADVLRRYQTFINNRILYHCV